MLFEKTKNSSYVYRPVCSGAKDRRLNQELFTLPENEKSFFSMKNDRLRWAGYVSRMYER